LESEEKKYTVFITAKAAKTTELEKIVSVAAVSANNVPMTSMVMFAIFFADHTAVFCTPNAHWYAAMKGKSVTKATSWTINQPPSRTHKLIGRITCEMREQADAYVFPYTTEA